MAGRMSIEAIEVRISDIQDTLSKIANSPGAPGSENEQLKLVIEKLKLEKEKAELEKQKAESEKEKAELEKQKAESEKEKAELEKQKAESEKEKAELKNEKLELESKKLESENEELKMELEKELLSMTKWLDQELPPFPLLYKGSCAKWTNKPKWFPKTVKKWENFEEAVRACTPASTGRRYSSQLLSNLANCAGDNEAGSTFCYETILSILLRVFFKNEKCTVEAMTLSFPSDKQDLACEVNRAEKRAEKLAKTSPLVPDLVLRKGAREGSQFPPGLNEFLVAEMKRPTFLRKTEQEEVPDLVKSYENYKTSGGCTDVVIGLGILQLITYMVTLRLGYAVLSTADVSYFVRLVKGEQYHDCVQISRAITWRSRDPTLIRALHYMVHTALEEMSIYKEFQLGEGDVPVTHSPATDFMEEIEEEEVHEEKPYRPSHVISTRNTMVGTRSRGDVQQSAASDFKLEETPASDLNLEETPFATGGWSGNVTRGIFDGQPVAVKLAYKGSDRGKALEDEGIAYNKLRQYWGQYLPKLVAHGTTVRGRIIYLATELIHGSAIGLKPLTQAVAREARSALRAVHDSGLVHGDIREDNILVVQGSVRLIDFGFAKPITSTAECDKEVKELEEILQNADYRNEHMENAQYGNENMRSTEVHKRKLLVDPSTMLHSKQVIF